MSSRLMSRLDADIARTTKRPDVDLLRAERIGLMAREGRMGEARVALRPLRERSQRQSQPALAAAVLLAEALVDYFSDFAPAARSKLQQACALSAQAQRTPLEALCLAWLAHLDYVHNDMAAMARNAALSLGRATADHHSARSRASLVVAMGYHQAGRLDLAQPWYGKARGHATEDGDVATTSALIHTMAALRASHVCRASVQQELDGASGEPALKQEALSALMAAESSGHFDARTGKHVLEVLHPIMRAQVLTLQGRHGEALALYQAHQRDALASGLGRMECCFRADVAWCQLQLGHPDAALAEAGAATAALGAASDVDDLALAHSRLAQIHERLGHIQPAAEHARLARLHWQQHAVLQAQTVAWLQAALPEPPG